MKQRVVLRVGDKYEQSRLDQFLAAQLSWLSRAEAQRAIDEGRVAIEPARPLKASSRLKLHEAVCLEWDGPSDDKALAEGVKLPVVFEDQTLLVLDKPGNLPVHPSGQYLSFNVLNILRILKGDGDAQDYPARLVHRLDRETSGILVLSKEKKAHTDLSMQWEDRQVAKTYLALVRGGPPVPAGRIDAPIGKDPHSSIAIKQGILADGQRAITDFATICRLDGNSLMLIRLHTGRQHQIRVHCSALGFPVLGDKLYGPDEQLFLDHYEGRAIDYAQSGLFSQRQLLHAYAVRFRHPVSQELLDLRTAIPEDFLALQQLPAQIDQLIDQAMAVLDRGGLPLCRVPQQA